MRSSTKKKVGPRSEPIESNQTSQKKQYSPPRFELLTPNQANVQLAERGLLGEAAIERILDAASRLGASGTGDQRSVAAGAKVGRIEDTRN